MKETFVPVRELAGIGIEMQQRLTRRKCKPNLSHISSSRHCLVRPPGVMMSTLLEDPAKEQFLYEQASHNGLARTCVVGQQESNAGERE